MELFFESSQSLKDRRRVLVSVKERLRHRFNISIAEADYGEKWQRGGFIISCAGVNPSLVESSLQAAVQFIEDDPRVQAVASELKYYE